jgi:hypothetical protein
VASIERVDDHVRWSSVSRRPKQQHLLLRDPSVNCQSMYLSNEKREPSIQS